MGKRYAGEGVKGMRFEMAAELNLPGMEEDGDRIVARAD